MKMFSRQFPIKRTNSRDHTTIIEGPNLFGPKSSSHVPKKRLPLSRKKKTESSAVFDDLYEAKTQVGLGERGTATRKVMFFYIWTILKRPDGFWKL